MIRGKKIEEQVTQPEHIRQVLAEIEANFPGYFASFAKEPINTVFDKHIRDYRIEHKAYREYLDPEALEEYEADPNAFKANTRTRCPIIRNCMNSQDEVMKGYKISFQGVKGRELLDTVRRIAGFGASYAANFSEGAHEHGVGYDGLGLESLNDESFGCPGVVGYGIQSSLLYGLYPHCFAHRSQNAVWSLYFLTKQKEFGLKDGSEFLVIRPDKGTCEQNYFYPADLFGFYSLRIFLLLRSACEPRGIRLDSANRYIYLSTFSDHVADSHRDDIAMFKRSSDDVERQPWF